MGTDRLICIRTDANNTIATGHMMRCLSIADACLQKGMQVCFVVSDEESRSVFDTLAPNAISSEYLPFVSVFMLQTALYHDLEKELPEFTDMIVANEVDILLLDSYFVTPSYLETLGQVTKTAYIDDLRKFDYPVDLLVNYDIIPDALTEEYKASYQNAGSCLLGGLYTPLRRQFHNCSFTIREFMPDSSKKPNILLTTGGSDPHHFCLHFLQEAKQMPVTFHVVIGRLYTDKDALTNYVKRHDNDNEPQHAKPFSDNVACDIVLHENVSDMAALMASCDFAISAAGTTLYELCALGVPSVSFTMADNQMVTSKVFDSQGAVYYAGDIRPASDFSLRVSALSYRPEINNEVIERIIHYLKEMTLMSDNYSKRKSAHETMRRLVDTNGASRIAEALLLCMK